MLDVWTVSSGEPVLTLTRVLWFDGEPRLARLLVPWREVCLIEAVASNSAAPANALVHVNGGEEIGVTESLEDIQTALTKTDLKAPIGFRRIDKNEQEHRTTESDG